MPDPAQPLYLDLYIIFPIPLCRPSWHQIEMLIPSSAPFPHPHYFSLQVLAWPSSLTLRLCPWCRCQPSGPSSSLSCCCFWASTARSVFSLWKWFQDMYSVVSCCTAHQKPPPMCKTHLVSLWFTSNILRISDNRQAGKAVCSHKGILLPLSTTLCEGYSPFNALYYHKLSF